MTLLRRHRLARLTDAGWRDILRRDWDEQARGLLAHWATHRLPLVVTRQSPGVVEGDTIALGLPAPAEWGRRRLALQVPRSALLLLDEFPRLDDVRACLPREAHRPVRELARALAGHRATARVFGSYGWQVISGRDHVGHASDLDLWIGVDGIETADAVARLLQGFGATRPRLDGELVFDHGDAVAWREWVEWRAGRSRAVLVKRLDGVRLEADARWCEAAALEEIAA